jgi:hypothetical protein
MSHTILSGVPDSFSREPREQLIFILGLSLDNDEQRIIWDAADAGVEFLHRYYFFQKQNFEI